MNKKRKYAYAAMTSTVLAIVVIIIVNFIVAALSDKVNLALDFTQGKILEFSDETKEVLDSLDMNVDIISLIPESDASSDAIHLDEVMKRYATYSEKINYKRIDATKNPGILSKYEINGKPLEHAYNVIFETERMYSVVRVEDVFERGKYNNMDYNQSAVMSAEQHFTSSIIKVTKGSNINAYVLSGHGELYGSEDFSQKILPGSGYSFKNLSLITEDVPDDADMVIVASPKNDYSVEEIAKLESFMAKGGNLQVFLGAQTPALSNIFAYLGEWGIEVGEGVVADNDASHYQGNRTIIVPEISDNEVTKEMMHENMSVIFPASRPLSVLKAVGTYTVDIASSSSEGYVKTNPSSVFDTFENGDEKGASKLCIMSEKSIVGTNEASRVLVFGSVDFLNMENNKIFYANTVSYMNEEPTLYIMPKLVIQQNLDVNMSTVYLYSLFVIVVIPVIIMAAGFIIWIRRRHM
ncbi:MAG: GldG family protein [Clostridia bacterium]|nr:GldG family protein [Clostridia bacterium]